MPRSQKERAENYKEKFKRAESEIVELKERLSKLHFSDCLRLRERLKNKSEEVAKLQTKNNFLKRIYKKRAVELTHSLNKIKKQNDVLDTAKTFMKIYQFKDPFAAQIIKQIEKL